MKFNNKEDEIRTFILFYLREISRRDLKVDIRNIGDNIHSGEELFPIGGDLSQITIDDDTLLAKLGRVGCVLGCGHVIQSLEEVSGFCGICGRIVCNKEGCLEICEESGITVCRKCRKMTRDGRIVSKVEAKRLPSLFKSLIRPKRKELTDGTE